jgi:hypothetical protein
MSWTGRYSANLLDSLAGRIVGPYTRPYIPALALLLWVGVLVWVLYQVKLAEKSPARILLAAMIATLVLSVTLSSAPLVSQSLYWGQGMRSLVPPLTLLVAYAGFLCKRTQVTGKQLPTTQGSGTTVSWMVFILLSFGISFAAAGFSETAAVLQLSLLSLALFAGLLFGCPDFRRSVAPLLAAGVAGSSIAILMILLAPGNGARADFYPRHPGFFEMVKITLYSALRFVRQSFGLDATFNSLFFLHQLLNFTALIVLPALAGLGFFGGQKSPCMRKRPLIHLLIGIPLAAGVLLVVCFLPAAYALSAGPPNRTKIIPDFLLVFSLATWGYLLGVFLREHWGVELNNSRQKRIAFLVTAICLLFTANALWDAYRVVKSAPAFRSYAAAWDENHQKILEKRASGRQRVVVQPLRNPAGLDEIAPDPRFWVNKCASDYYGVRVSSK